METGASFPGENQESLPVRPRGASTKSLRGVPPGAMPYVEYDEVEAICSDCGRTFRSEEALATHRVEAHEGTEPPPSPPAPAAIRCLECGREFTTESGRARHRARAHPT